MKVAEQAVEELQQILLEEYGKNLTIEETRAIGKKLINLYQTLLNQNQNNHETQRVSTITS